MSSPIARRTVLLSTLGLTSAGVAACSSGTSNSSSTTSSASTTVASSSSTSSAVTSPTLADLASVKSAFTTGSYSDATSGKALPYNVFLPKGYSTSTKYPVVVYIADSSLVGKSVDAPLSEYGALIWASEVEQAKHASIVVVPEYPEVILDDHSGFTTTDWVELTARFVTWLKTKYSVDTARVYGTGQSMGCMTTLLLTAEHADLYTATMLVSGQWDKTKLAGLAQRKFFSVAAAGDTNATGGQTDMKAILTTAKVPFESVTLDATAPQATQDATVRAALAKGDHANFASFAAGTVMTANPGKGMEHMASFQPAYELTSVRDWLFAQTA